jgi:hypothetical protein
MKLTFKKFNVIQSTRRPTRDFSYYYEGILKRYKIDVGLWLEISWWCRSEQYHPCGDSIKFKGLERFVLSRLTNRAEMSCVGSKSCRNRWQSQYRRRRRKYIVYSRLLHHFLQDITSWSDMTQRERKLTEPNSRAFQTYSLVHGFLIHSFQNMRVLDELVGHF